jgi:hypothetical protein
MKRLFAAVFLFTVLLASGESLLARSCSGNGDVLGAYGFVGARSFVAVPIPPPGTTGVPGSPTAVGNLLKGANDTPLFATAGRLFADGTGNWFATSSATPATLERVGTYTVNSDCTISITLNDVFVTMGGTPTTRAASATFEGIIVDDSKEIQLAQTGASGTGTVLSLKKMAQFSACSNASLSGTFGILAPGFTAGAPGTGTLAPFNLVGRISADGAGNFGLDRSVGAPLQQRQFTGTYTVNTDCTGTARLVDPDRRTRNISFVLVSPSSTVVNPNTNDPSPARVELQFVFTDSGVTGTGTGKQL